MLIFIPLTPDALARLRSDGLRRIDAFAATPALYAALDYDDTMSEDAEFAALTYASVDALTGGSRRLVAVADVQDTVVVAPADGDPEGFGHVQADAVAWRQVTALFIGDPHDAAAERSTAARITATPLAQAWETDPVADLVATTDLLWFGPEEADLVAETLADG